MNLIHVLKDLVLPFRKALSWVKWRVYIPLRKRVRDEVHAPRSEVDFAAWVARGSGRRSAAFPNVWRTLTPLPLTDPARVAVVVHAYYYDVLEEIITGLGAINVPFDLFVTYVGTRKPIIDVAGLSNLRTMVLLPCENQGRDILPLIQLVNSGILDPYLLICKVHTKRSVWRAEHDTLAGTGDTWRGTFLQSLLGSKEQVAEILAAFSRDDGIGLVTAPGNVLGIEYWGGNYAHTKELLRRVELQIKDVELEFAAGSMYWARGFVLQGLRSLGLSAQDFEPELGQADGTTAHAVERALGILTREAGLRITTTADLSKVKSATQDTPVSTQAPAAPASEAKTTTDSAAIARYVDGPLEPRARLVPFYLPQFHAIPENDRWWGKGFTEWANVTAAIPVYLGHNQPRLAGELGYYDLEMNHVREAQLQLASEHGIEGFMYYYYWFAGERLLSMPIEKLRESDISKPFCLMWANENWTRRWDGRTQDVLIAQAYDEVPAEAFIDDVLEFLADPRYIRVAGKPVLAVYRLGQLPDPAATIAHWRARAREAGVGELHILSVDVAQDFDGIDERSGLDIDGTLGFPPHNIPVHPVWRGAPALNHRFDGNLISYARFVKEALSYQRAKNSRHYPGVMVAFDNTARRQWTSDIWWGANPYTFHRWLLATVRDMQDRTPEQRLVFINAWNEWAEAAVLEPTARTGRAYLHAVRSVVLS